ncbi:CPK12 [Symbiodinium sp. CCMP2456]|nr:CPK12 [Symbiodinium sp. CCMP2456]
MQQALEMQAERRHQFVLDHIYREANAHIAHLESTADANHRQQIDFVRQSTMVLVGQLHSETRVLEHIAHSEQAAARSLQNQLERTEKECHDERSSATQLRAHLESAVRMHAAENRQHEHARTELRTAFDDNRNQLLEYLGQEFEEKLQWEENECNFRLTSEEQQYDSLIVDLEDRNAELVAEVNSLREVPPFLQGVLGRTQRFNIGEPQDSHAPGVELSTAELSDLKEPANIREPKQAAEILAEALKSAIKKPEDDDKPKAKEAESVKLPDFPNPETYRSWKITVREAVRAASDKPDEAFKWVQEVYSKEADIEKLRETGKFLTLDTKILSSLSRVARGDLGRQIINYKESVLLMFEHYF